MQIIPGHGKAYTIFILDEEDMRRIHEISFAVYPEAEAERPEAPLPTSTLPPDARCACSA